MASTNKTPNYNLNQWVGTDTPQRIDFNDDNAAIDAALKANADAAEAALQAVNTAQQSNRLRNLMGVRI